MRVHRIRLRAPWRSEVLADGSGRWARKCHRPTNLDPAQRVWLVVSSIPCDGTAQLNGRTLGRLHGAVEARFDVAALLDQRNEVVIHLEGLSPSPGDLTPPFDVCLEIA